MLKKYCLALVLLFYSINCSANIFDDMLDAICNIDQDDITETWNDQGNIKNRNKNSTDLSNALCPPWNKNSGRPGTCLQQFGFPGRFIGFYLQSCAQDTKENTFFEPRIAIHTQTCNATFCFSKSTTLKWDGECLVWPGAYGLPILRICARIANPATHPTLGDNKIDEVPADPGYTLGRHLNLKGENEADKNPIGYDGKEIIMTKPKLCAYSDPGLVNLISDTGIHTDALDWNPTNQPLHYTTKTHWLAEILKFLITYREHAIDSISQLLGVLGNGDGVKVLQSILGAVGKILELFNAPAVFLIKTFGSLNSAVDSVEMGCVEIPLGPYPPPFCNKLNNFKPMPTTERICGNAENGNVIPSLANDKCTIAEDSNTVNNLINNSIRISMDDLVVLCNDSDDATKTDKCVKIKGGPFLAHTIHDLTNNDIIKSCASNGGIAPCVESNIPLGCTGTGCVQKFRLVYMPVLTGPSNNSAGRSTNQPIAPPSNYFAADLPDCDGTSKTCQIVWGVNIGEFKDVSLSFNKIDDGKDLESTTKLGDKDFKVSIKRKPDLIKLPTGTNFTQNPDDICVFNLSDDNNSLVGCEKRDPLTKIDLYPCNASEAADLYCNNDIKTNYFAPQVVASIKSKDGRYSTKTLIKALTVQNPFDDGYKANLAGYSISSFIANIPNDPNKERIFKPFDINNPRSITPLSIYGIYKGLSKAEDITPNKNMPGVNFNKEYFEQIFRNYKGYVVADPQKIKYTQGLEYMNDHYIRGGTHICLTPEDIAHCPLNEQNCVLTKLKNPIIDCVEFRKKQAEMPQLRVCNTQDNIKALSPSEIFMGVLPIYKLPNSTCYENKIAPQEEICSVTTDLQNRIDPSPDKGIILDRSQYYKTNINASSRAEDHKVEIQNAIINCDTFIAKKSLITDLKLCPTEWLLDDSCTSEEIPGINGGPGITINKCSNINCYVNNKNKAQEVCVVQATNPPSPYDPNKQTTRDKTPEELGLCIEIPQPLCPAISSFTPENGNATWPERKVGEPSQGTCRAGWNPIDPSKPLERYCVANALRNIVAFEELDDNVGCKPAKIDFTYDNGNDNFWDIPKVQDDNGFSFGRSLNQNLDSINSGKYSSNLKFKIDNKDSLQYFRLSSVAYDDYVRITVNGNIVYDRGIGKPNQFDSCFYNQLYWIFGIICPDGANYFIEKDINVDLIPYLKEGDNIITVQLIVVGTGGLYYRIDYKFKE